MIRDSKAAPKVRIWRSPALRDMEVFAAAYPVHAFPRHFHDEYIVGIMTHGTEALRDRGASQVAPAGSLLLMNPGEWHSNYSVDEVGFAYRTLYPSVDLVRGVFRDIYGRDHDPPWLLQPVQQPDPVTRTMLLALHDSIVMGTSALEQQSRFLALIHRLFIRYAADAPALPPLLETPGYVKTARDYLESHYAENTRLERLSVLTGISPFHLLRTFRRWIGLSPSQYQRQIRIVHAKRLLRTGLPVVQVAADTGFVDQSHLTRHFRLVVGVTPGQYAQRRKNLQDAGDPSPLG